ncbi:hypothetical protein JYU34_010179 [Plutella xylostella]|uniref:Uncharacterized protein n=1 Tax=Plutella xylostella TaxID=51655 RepID=A0ABQ7QHZ3_PLUXY|nr:hypothetical protein JYU34_010179 [Plutella xylostella]
MARFFSILLITLVTLTMQTQASPQFESSTIKAFDVVSDRTISIINNELDHKAKTLAEIFTTLIRAFQEFKTNGILSFNNNLVVDLVQIFEIVKEYFAKSNLIRDNKSKHELAFEEHEEHWENMANN